MRPTDVTIEAESGKRKLESMGGLGFANGSSVTEDLLSGFVSPLNKKTRLSDVCLNMSVKSIR